MNTPAESTSVTDQLKAATALLKSVASNRALMADLSPDERRELISVAGEIYNPDMV